MAGYLQIHHLTLFFHSTCEIQDEDYYLHFTNENQSSDRSRAGLVKVIPRGILQPSVTQPWDSRAEALRTTWEGVSLPPPPDLGQAPLSQSGLRRLGPTELPHSSVWWCLSPGLSLQTLLSMALNHQDLSRLPFPEGQKRWTKSHSCADASTHTQPTYAPNPSMALSAEVWRLGPSRLTWFLLGLFKTKCTS